jgi:TetR/AcrR family transcriptional repressor of bet genes
MALSPLGMSCQTSKPSLSHQGIAALIDGIWLRGALTPGGINSELAQRIITDYLERQLPPTAILSDRSTRTAR